jgi:hypothetical protein
MPQMTVCGGGSPGPTPAATGAGVASNFGGVGFGPATAREGGENVLGVGSRGLAGSKKSVATASRRTAAIVASRSCPPRATQYIPGASGTLRPASPDTVEQRTAWIGVREPTGGDPKDPAWYCRNLQNILGVASSAKSFFDRNSYVFNGRGGSGIPLPARAAIMSGIRCKGIPTLERTTITPHPNMYVCAREPDGLSSFRFFLVCVLD